MNNKNKIIAGMLLLFTIIFTLGLAELSLRIIYNKRLSLAEDERSIFYRYDRDLGWFPQAGSEGVFKASRPIRIQHNSKGFRDIEHTIGSKPGLVFLGDSFVWGYDVEAQERFSDIVQKELPGWSIYNFGVSGYGTDQEYLLLRSLWDTYKPKILFLVFNTKNDEQDDSSNWRYGYLKPYFTIQAGDLQLKGVPVPQLESSFFASHRVWARSYLLRLIVKAYFNINPPKHVFVPDPTKRIISRMNQYVLSKGAVFMVGMIDRQPIFEQFFKREKIRYVDLSNSYRYPNPIYGKHWTPQGHRFASGKILKFLASNNYSIKKDDSSTKNVHD